MCLAKQLLFHTHILVSKKIVHRRRSILFQLFLRTTFKIVYIGRQASHKKNGKDEMSRNVRIHGLDFILMTDQENH